MGENEGVFEGSLSEDSPLIRVAIVGQDSSAIATSAKVIDAEPDFDVVGTGISGADATQIAIDLRPEVLMLDLSLPDASGESVTRSVIDSGDRHPEVLGLTSSVNDDLAFAAICAGARGVCTEDDPPELVAQSVRSVAAGDAAVSPPLLGRLLRRLMLHRPKEVGTCSSREVEVLSLVAEGASNPEIADQLFISQATVRSHVQSLRNKLGVRDRVGLVVFAHTSGLAPPISSLVAPDRKGRTR